MIEILACGPLTTVQDAGRPGHLSLGLARGGAADRQALLDAAALLSGVAAPGIESAGAPLRLRPDVDCTIALTGAPMRVTAGGKPLGWHASHVVQAGIVLDLKPSGEGVYSYIHVAGGLDVRPVMGSAAAHLIAGIGAALHPGDRLRIRAPATPAAATLVRPDDRYAGGTLRCVATPQTALFRKADLDRFEGTAFTRATQGNRQGIKLDPAGAGFATEGQLNLLSDFVLPGDVQMTGDGIPYILGPECQTTGGYPRIAHVVTADLPRALQAPPGAVLRFAFVDLPTARAAVLRPPAVAPTLRDPAAMADLLSYDLIDGVIDAKGEPWRST
ncbi:biotin-dependent carboxyltransferase family protein [Jannaschia sp. LMIT008]|uniref:5-oxoprolinase subunit C family protein n=1 Tax=Jannaschia maritima TaxID=3032585 RepID=UPI0028111294|nr:biotin-dependent carboxyltransferase family protein [Jannaschia sp. LMIT008]